MGDRAKKRPEFDLPPLLVETVREYFGKNNINKLNSEQSKEVMGICVSAAGSIGLIMEEALKQQKQLEHLVDKAVGDANGEQ